MSLLQFGWTLPLLVADDVVIAGNGRLEAAKLLVMSGQHELAHGHSAAYAPVLDSSHLSEIERREYEILDNKLHDESGWDVEKLRHSLETMQTLMDDREDWQKHSELIEEMEFHVGLKTKDGDPNINSTSYNPLKDEEEYILLVKCDDENHQNNTYETIKNLGFDVTIV